MNKYKTEIKWQVFVYGIYAALGLFQYYSEHPKEGIYFKEILGVLGVTLSNNFCVNFIGNWLMFKHPISKRPLKFLFLISSLFLAFFCFRYLTAYPQYSDILKTYNGNDNKESLEHFIFLTSINCLINYVLGLGLYSIKKSLYMERKARLLETKFNEAQLQTLKYQINPHFLYNTLSYMYAQARPVSDKLSKSILILSEMMRYSLDKTDTSGFVLIEKEIHYIENFIEIHELRFDDSFYVNFEVEGIVGNKKVAPMILITFIENAIKHGKINDKKYPVNINLNLHAQHLDFEVKNFKQLGRKDTTSGIGLENTRKRLQLLYPQRHSLEINEIADTFVVKLMITFDL